MESVEQLMRAEMSEALMTVAKGGKGVACFERFISFY